MALMRILTVAGAAVLALGGCGSVAAERPSSPSGSATASGLSAADVAAIRAVRGQLSTSPDAVVEAVRAPGERVFALILPNVGLGAETATVKSHELLVVRSATDVPQGFPHAYGSTAAATVVEIVIDTTDGRVVTGIIGTTSPETVPSPSLLGPTTQVRLSA